MQKYRGRVYVNAHVRMCARTHVGMYVCLSVCMWIYVCMYVHTYVCVRAWVCVHANAELQMHMSVARLELINSVEHVLGCGCLNVRR